MDTTQHSVRPYSRPNLSFAGVHMFGAGQEDEETYDYSFLKVRLFPPPQP
jgi:hypothetical protein